MTEKLKTALAAKNGMKKERAKELIAKEIAENGKYSLSREIGIVGDALEYLFDLVSSLHPDTVSAPAFEQWRAKVKEIKNNINAKLGVE